MIKEAQHIVILGAAESGVGAAILAKTQGKSVFVSDAGIIAESAKKDLLTYNVPFEEGGHQSNQIWNADLIVKSPGIPQEAAIIKAIKEKGISMVSEIDYAHAFTNAKTICITGSNGKTTTTLWIYHILKKAGLKVGLAGNVGQSFAKQVALSDHEFYVLELSSFQLEDMQSFHANIGVITNISPDHLDRYNYQMENYVAAKFRLLDFMGTGDHIIYNADDPWIIKFLKKNASQAQRVPFSSQNPVEMGGYLNNEQLILNIKTTITMSIHELALKGKHNAQNALAAGIAARLLDIRESLVRESLMDFENVEHRLEFVASVNGIEFINDSKATNVNAAWYALESMTNPTVWIVGGVDKGNDYSELLPLVKEKVKAIVCLGTENQKIIEAFSGEVDTVVEASSAEEAVAHAYRLAQAKDTVLLSPACASFDLFQNYEDRGCQFKAAVRKL